MAEFTTRGWVRRFWWLELTVAAAVLAVAHRYHGWPYWLIALLYAAYAAHLWLFAHGTYRRFTPRRRQVPVPSEAVAVAPAAQPREAHGQPASATVVSLGRREAAPGSHNVRRVYGHLAHRRRGGRR